MSVWVSYSYEHKWTQCAICTKYFKMIKILKRHLHVRKHAQLWRAIFLRAMKTEILNQNSPYSNLIQIRKSFIKFKLATIKINLDY